MILKKLIAVIVLGISVTTIAAQTKLLKNATETKEISQKVAQLFKENKIHEAIETMRPYWPFPASELDALEETTIKNLAMVGERFGDSEGIIKGKEELLKDFAIKETYFVKYQHTAVRLIFVYFKNVAGWTINSFKWDDNFYEEFK